MSEIQIGSVTIASWIIIPIIFFLWVTILFVVKKIIFRAIRTFAQKTKTQIDDLFIKSANFPLTFNLTDFYQRWGRC